LSFLFFFIGAASSYELVPKAPMVKGRAKTTDNNGKNLHFFLFDSKYGYVSDKGEMIIPPSYLEAGNFNPRGLAYVKTSSGRGIIDSAGCFTVLPLLSEIRFIEPHDNSYFIGNSYGWEGLLSKDGDWLVNPRFSQVTDLSFGYYRIKHRGKYGLMNVFGDILSEIIYDDIYPPKKFNDLYVFKFMINKKYGVLSSKGEILLSHDFDGLEIGPEFDETGNISISQNKKFGVINIFGKMILQPQFHLIAYNKRYGTYFIYERPESKNPVEYDLSGKKIGLVPKVKEFEYVKDKLFRLSPCVKRFEERGAGDNYTHKKRYGFCNPLGQDKISVIYDWTDDFIEDGLAKVYKNKKFGYVNIHGKIIVPIEYDEIKNYKNGLVQVSKKGKWGILDVAKGTYVKNLIYDSAPKQAFNDETYFVETEGKIGIIKYTGEEIYPQELTGFRNYPNSHLLFVKKDGLWGLLNDKGEWFLDPIYQKVESAYENMFVVAYNDKFALVDAEGKLIAYVSEECGLEVVRNKDGMIVYPPNFACFSDTL
jgi:hypothetical protein